MNNGYTEKHTYAEFTSWRVFTKQTLLQSNHRPHQGHKQHPINHPTCLRPVNYTFPLWWPFSWFLIAGMNFGVLALYVNVQHMVCTLFLVLKIIFTTFIHNVACVYRILAVHSILWILDVVYIVCVWLGPNYFSILQSQPVSPLSRNLQYSGIYWGLGWTIKWCF